MTPQFITFITIISYVIGTGATLFVVFRVLGYLTYSDMEKRLDAGLHGYVKRFPIIRPVLLATICWAWVFAYG